LFSIVVNLGVKLIYGSSEVCGLRIKFAVTG
jgi:hypothetical protein